MRASEGEKDAETGFILGGIAATLLEYRMIGIEENFARVGREIALTIG